MSDDEELPELEECVGPRPSTHRNRRIYYGHIVDPNGVECEILAVMYRCFIEVDGPRRAVCTYQVRHPGGNIVTFVGQRPVVVTGLL
jgi:hypothetical protein